MNESTFWLGVWSILGATIVSIALVTSSYYKQQDAYIVEMVLAGSNPIAAQCGLTDTLGNNPTCVSYIMGEKK
jgi:hypothetical protein